MYTVYLTELQAGFLIRLIESDQRPVEPEEEAFLNALHRALHEGQATQEPTQPVSFDSGDVRR